MGLDIEDVKIMSGWWESLLSQHHDPFDTAPLQTARKALLSESQNHSRSPDSQERVKMNTSASLSQKYVSESYQDVQQLSSEACTRRQSSLDMLCKKAVHYVQGGDDGDGIKPAASRTVLKFTAPGQVEHMDRVHAGKQYLVFRRLYSELEREQVRKKKKQKTHSRQVEAMKRKKEADRKMVEDEINSVHSSSIISTSVSEDKQLAEEWAELVQEEERRQQLQKAKELERYTTALKLRLRELIELKKLNVPPLCSCGKTLWDTNPQTCANNCIFYRNSKGMRKLGHGYSMISSFVLWFFSPPAYAKALSNLLQSSLNTS